MLCAKKTSASYTVPNMTITIARHVITFQIVLHAPEVRALRALRVIFWAFLLAYTEVLGRSAGHAANYFRTANAAPM